MRYSLMTFAFLTALASGTAYAGAATASALAPVVHPLVRLLQTEVAQIDPQILAALAATLISLALTYVPGLNVRWAALSPTAQRLAWVIVLLIGSAGLLTYNCNAEAVCLGLNWRGYLESFVRVLLGGVGGSVGTFLLTTAPAAVRHQKEASKAKAEAASDARYFQKTGRIPPARR